MIYLYTFQILGVKLRGVKCTYVQPTLRFREDFKIRLWKNMNQRFETRKTETGIEPMSSHIPTFDPILKIVNAVH